MRLQLTTLFENKALPIPEKNWKKPVGGGEVASIPLAIGGLTADKILNKIKSKILQPEKELDSEPVPLELIPSLQIRLLTVSCPQTLTSDGGKFEQ